MSIIDNLKTKTRKYIIDTEKIAPSAVAEVTEFVGIAAKLAKVQVKVNSDIWPRITLSATGRKKRLIDFEEQLNTVEGTTLIRADAGDNGKLAVDIFQDDPEMLTRKEYAAKYGVPLSTVNNWCSRGVLDTKLIDKTKLIPDIQGVPVKNPETGVWVFIMPNGEVRR